MSIQQIHTVRDRIYEKLQQKTSWGRNEIKDQIQLIVDQVLIEEEQKIDYVYTNFSSNLADLTIDKDLIKKVRKILLKVLRGRV